MDDVEAMLHAAKLFADPLRMKILLTLEGGALSVNDLAVRLGSPQPRVSSHLALLRDAGWVFVLVDGRQRRYGIARPEVQEAMHALAATSSTAPGKHTSFGDMDARLRQARTCYDHLGGVVGVTLCDHLLQKGWLIPLAEGVGKHQPSFSLTIEGQSQLLARGVKLPTAQKAQRRFAYACPDWTESRPHLGGLLGVALLQHLKEMGSVQEEVGSRAVTIHNNLLQWLNE